MRLKSLEIQGFKTFPDKTSLLFEENMVAVVGPNGSGKSNVSDAIRWVLGEQSTRVLRCSKMEDVIFKGTTSRKALGFAEVTLNIENEDRALNFDTDKIAITRRYYRSGESEYLINKAAVRLKDINELFMDTGLGRDGYSIIGQGKIDAIVAAKSEDRREIFEEASGISRYRYRKEESERRLEKAEENLIRLRDILSELEERVEPLRIQAEKAKRFLEYDGEKKELEIGIWAETLNRSGKILREEEDKMRTAQGEHEEIATRLEALTAQMEETFRAVNECTVQMEEVRGEATLQDEEVVRLAGEVSVLQNDILHSQQTIERLTRELQEAAVSRENIHSEIAEKQGEILVKNSEIDTHNTQYIALADQLEGLRRGSDTVSQEIDDAMIAAAKTTATLSEERVRFSSLSSSVTEIESRGGDTDAAITLREAAQEELRVEEAELTEMLGDFTEKLRGLENSAAGYDLRLKTRRGKADALKSELDRAILDAGEQGRRVKILEDLERNFEGFTQSVKVVMREVERGTIRGVHGPVTKLLRTPQEYAVAIETALGGAMQNLVVGTEQDAKAAIAMLKQRDGGRATFLPLSTIRGTVIDTRDAAACEGFVGVAAALVSCEDQYIGIKNSILGRTAVAQNLDCAVQIAKRTGYRFRVVTLDGQVVNAGGSLTGGSLARNSGLLSRGAEIERIREKAKMLGEKAALLQGEHKALLADVATCEGELGAIRGEISALQEDKIRTEAELVAARRDLAGARSAVTQLLLEKDNAQKRSAELRAAMDTIGQEILRLENAVVADRKRAESLTGSRQDQQRQCDEIAEKLQEIRLWGFAAQKDKEALEAAIEMLIARKQEGAGLAERLAGECATAKENIGNIESEIANREAASVQKRMLAAQKRQVVESLAQKRAELEERSGSLRIAEREALTSRENIGREIARLQERQDNLQKEYDSITEKLWEEYELTRRQAEEQGAQIEDLQMAQRRLGELKNKIRALGSVNVAAVVEYEEVAERYVFLKEQVADVENSRIALLRLIGELTHNMQEQFSVRFAEINRNFTQIFKELFGGGTAALSFFR